MLGHHFVHRTHRFVGQSNALLVFTYVAVIIAMTEAWNAAPTRSVFKSFIERNPNAIFDSDGNGLDSIDQPSRRGILRQGLATVMIGTASSFSLVASPSSAHAKVAAAATTPDKSKEAEGLMSASDAADLIHPIPTFTIVDKKGIPFTVVGEDAKVTGYFFTSYTEAARILQLAKKSADKAIAKAKADKEDDIGINPWKSARVSTIPLDYAVTVVSKSMRTRGGGVYFKVVPAEDDINDALAVTGDEDLAEGKVPLFYYEDFNIDDGGQQKTPLYFRKDDLEKQWRRSNPKEALPKISVTELFSLLTELVRPGGNDSELRNLVFVPLKESESKRQDCIKKGGDEPPFVVGKRIIVL
jgi:hypothetical protein